MGDFTVSTRRQWFRHAKLQHLLNKATGDFAAGHDGKVVAHFFY